MNTNKRESKSREDSSSIGVDSRPFVGKGVEALAGRGHQIWPACLSPSGGRLNKDASPMRPYSRIVQSSIWLIPLSRPRNGRKLLKIH